ncbi:hypothetical protein KAU11_03005 [Candidatus Babeliales bacterium]|nr:hypothetical protein [Candidatus Babeliales bacterium]
MKARFFIPLLITSSLASQTYSNRTFMKLRPVGREMPIEKTTWYHSQRNADNLKNCAKGGAVQIVGFYKRSHDTDNMGKYFGIREQNSFTYAQGSVFPHLATEDLIHDNAGTRGALSGTLKLKPTRSVEGVRIGLYKNLNDGYFVKANLPVLRVRHDLHEKTEAESTIGTTGLLDLLSGSYSNPLSANDGNAQDALKYAKIDGQRKGDFGLGDCDITLGRRLLDEELFDCAVYARLTLPTSNEPESEFLFEPIRGNGKHWEFGVGMDGSFDLWSDEQSHVELLFTLDVAYGFEASEKRTFNSAVDIKVVPPWSRYMLIGEKGKQGLQPLANISTISAKVSPGFQGEAMITVGYRTEHVAIDVGYDMYSREAESIVIKDWTDDRYAFTHATLYSTADNFLDNVTHYLSGIDKSTIQKSELDAQSASTPGSLTHTIFAGVGYMAEQRGNFMGSVGTAYEWARENSAISCISIWCKVGMAF